MKKPFHRFNVKISSLFLLLLFTMGAALILVTMKITEKRRIEADQLVNRNLARDMAREIEPHLRANSGVEGVEPIIHHMMVLNPAIEIYLLDGEGRILAFFAEPGKRMKAESVDLGPVGVFLEGTGKLPILGDDPCHPGLKKHFSAARMRYGGGEGYLYVVLQGTVYDRLFDTLNGKYLVSALWRGFLISLLSVGIIGLILFAFLTKRLQRVARGVAEFKNGNYDGRVRVASKDEFGDLAAAFNHMADRIVQDMETLKSTDRLRRELVANVSHDLRSPFASIQGYVETILMKEDSITKEELHRYLEVIMNDSQILNKLIDELFELSILDARQVRPVLEPFSLSELAQDVVMKLEPRASKLGVRLTAETPRNLCMVEADVGLIERVLSNLVENALDSTNGSGAVVLRLDEQDETVRMSLVDTGRGIPGGEIPFIFNRFYRGEIQRPRSKPGSGLGLAISQKIVELHHGSIRVLSETGKGSTFSFDLQRPR